MRMIDLTGQKFGRLVVIKKGSLKYNKIHWVCKCVCGNICSISGSNLKSGHTVSCGCYKKEIISKIMKELGRLKIGIKNPFFGKFHTKETKQKIRLFHLGKPRFGDSKNWKHNECTKLKISKGNKNKKRTLEHRIQKSKILKKIYREGRHPNWKGGITPWYRRERSSFKYKLWREAVFKRDNFTCVWCGGKEKLETDHIKPFIKYPKLRTNIKNGRTLCKKCHIKRHCKN
jgi:hypothetical protein